MAVMSELNGIICVYKPVGFTSFDVIAKMRGILKMKKLGHAGTLDPMAEGVLPVFAGCATKACDMLPDHDRFTVQDSVLALLPILRTAAERSFQKMTHLFTKTGLYLRQSASGEI